MKDIETGPHAPSPNDKEQREGTTSDTELNKQGHLCDSIIYQKSTSSTSIPGFSNFTGSSMSLPTHPMYGLLDPKPANLWICRGNSAILFKSFARYWFSFCVSYPRVENAA